MRKGRKIREGMIDRHVRIRPELDAWALSKGLEFSSILNAAIAKLKITEERELTDQEVKEVVAAHIQQARQSNAQEAERASLRDSSAI